MELLPTREELAATVAAAAAGTKRPRDSLMQSDAVPEEDLTVHLLVRRIMILTNLRVRIYKTT